jgi:hypothetical protein
MAESDPASVTAGNSQPRWRFSIGQLFTLLAIVGCGLALFKEYKNNAERKQRQFDPVPLEITDPADIHVRLIPYHFGSSFLYRVHLPEAVDYELCVAETKLGDPEFPVPQKTIPMPASRRLHALEEATRKPLPVEVRIAGFTTQIDKTTNTHRLILRADSHSAGLGGQLGEEEIITIRAPSDHNASSPLNAHETKSYGSDEMVVLWRECWKRDHRHEAYIYPLPLTGSGLTVWLRKASPPPSESADVEKRRIPP